MFGHGGAVTAQQRRQVAGVGEPGPRRRRRREHPPAQVRHGDHLPLQALGGVHGQDLHPVVATTLTSRGGQPVLHLLGGVQVGQQSGHRRARPRGREVGHHIGERVEVFGARPALPTTGRAARTSASTPSTRRTSATRSGSGCVQMRAQRGQFTAQRDDPADGPPAEYAAAAARDRRSRRPGRRRRRPGGGLRDDLVGRRGVARRAESSSSTARRHSAAMSRPPSRQRGPVSTRIAAAPGGGVGGQPQHRHHVGDLGHGEQPGQPDDLDRDAARGQRVGHRRGIGVAAHQHRGGRRGRAALARLVVHAAPTGRPPSRVRPPRRTAVRTGWCPAGASGRGRSVRTATERRRASADTALARCSARGGLRQLVRSSSVGAGRAVGTAGSRW